MGAIPADWRAFDRWNAALADEFFGGRFGGRPVYLDLEPEALARVARSAGEGADAPDAALIAVVAPTLQLEERAAMFGVHRRRYTLWKRSPEGPPPVIAVLAVLSLVAEQMSSDATFRASNYYGRLLETLDQDSSDRRLRQKVVRAFGEESHVLWAALNAWLDEDRATRGIPTAFAFDYRVHVGIPISQALVRDADRTAMRDLFQEFRLQPGAQIPHADMLRLLREWLPGSSLSTGLKALCENEDALGRVADVACLELAAWGGEATASGQASGRLGFTAKLRRHPRPRVKLGMAVRVGEVTVPSLALPDAPDQAAQTALADANGSLVLGEADQDGWADVENIQEVSLPSALVAIFNFQAGSQRFRRIPRRLVLLEYDEYRHRYREVDRAHLGSEYLLLAAESLRPQLEVALGEAARPGWKLQPELVQGVPAGWRVYSQVQLMGLISSPHIDLSPLQPVAWTQLSLVGGLKLSGHRRWLSASPPEVSASSLTGDRALVVLIDDAEELTGDESEAGARHGREQPLGSTSSADVFTLDEFELEPGTHRVALIAGDDPERTPLTSAAFKLAEPNNEDELVDVGYATPLTGQAMLTPTEGTTAVIGARVTSAPTPSERADDAGTLPSQLRQVDLEETYPETVEETRHASAVLVSLPTCMQTGAHYFVLPDAGPRAGRRDDIHATCQHCGFERYFPARPRRRHRHETRASSLTRAAARPVNLPPREDAEELDWDKLLAAVSTDRYGSWDSFGRLVGQVDDHPWAALEAARALAALGHLEVSVDLVTLRPTRWAVTAPTIVTTPEDAFLAGWRSEALLDAVGRSATRRGGAVEWLGMASGPTSVRLSGLDETALDEVAQEAGGTTRPIALALDSGARLARELPPLRTVAHALPRVAPPTREAVERFSLAGGGWGRTEDLTRFGAYRSTRPPVRYWLHDNSSWHRVDGRWAEWLATDVGDELLAYSVEHSGLACYLGAQLPGLYERAVVLCSGLLPVPDGRGHTVYAEVPAGVATAIGRSLDPSPRASGTHAAASA